MASISTALLALRDREIRQQIAFDYAQQCSAPLRDATVAVGGVPARRRAGLQVHQLLRQIPRLGVDPQAFGGMER